jgi:hypothetical protein
LLAGLGGTPGQDWLGLGHWFLKDVLLFRGKFVLLAAFLQLQTIGQKIECSANLAMYPMPCVVVRRIPEISIYRKRLFHA